MATHRILLDLDCLIAAHSAQPNTKAQQSAWEYLSELTAATMEGNAYLIPSAHWERTAYRSTADSCTCPGHANGRYCWHREAAATLDLARENAAIDQTAECDAYLDLYVADQASIGHTVTRRDHQIVRSVSTRAAQSSGISDLWA